MMSALVQNLDYVFYISAGLIVIAAATAAFVIADPSGPAGSYWSRYLHSFEGHLRLLAADATPVEIVVAQVLGALALVGCWFVFDFFYALLLIPAIVPGTYLGLQIAYMQRCQAVALQLDGWLLMLSNMLKATGSVGNAIGSSAELTHRPLKDEVELIMKHMEVGTTIEDALANMYKRVPSRGLYTVVTSLRVGRRLGGDLPSLLAENAAALRESERIDAFIRGQVTQGKVQMIVLGLAPALLIYMFVKVSPGFFDPLLDYVLGPYIMIGCGALWMLAMYVGVKIMNVDA